MLLSYLPCERTRPVCCDGGSLVDSHDKPSNDIGRSVSRFDWQIIMAFIHASEKLQFLEIIFEVLIQVRSKKEYPTLGNLVSLRLVYFSAHLKGAQQRISQFVNACKKKWHGLNGNNT